MVRRTACATVVAALLALATPVAAQSVYGVVRLAPDSMIAAGALVALVDSTGHEVVRTFTSVQGRYVLQARAPGAYHLRVLRIGYEPWVSPGFFLAAHQPRSYSPVVPGVVVTLPSITVTGTSRCGAPTDTTGFIATLWQQVTTALRATTWAQEHQLFRFTSSEYLQKFDAQGRLILTERHIHADYSGRLGQALSADSLVRGGFVEEAPGGPVFHAPDAQVLFSEPFLATHCFGVRRGEGRRAGLVGLTFRPIDPDHPNDIRGVLWIGRKTLELRTLEFEFTSLGLDIHGAQANGEIDFERLPDGAWAIRRWRLRAPIASYSTGMQHPRFGGYSVEGGVVTAVYTARGEPIRVDSAADSTAPGR